MVQEDSVDQSRVQSQHYQQYLNLPDLDRAKSSNPSTPNLKKQVLNEDSNTHSRVPS